MSRPAWQESYDAHAAVLAVDLSPGMLAVARRLSPEIDLRVADAHALPFNRGVFDAVTCSLSLSHFDERERALREVLRVLRPGGRLVASTWAEGSRIPTRAVGRLLDHHGGTVDALDEGTWLRPEHGSEVLRQAGFASVPTTTEFFRGSFADAEEALAWSLAWPLGAARLARVDPRCRKQFFADAREALAGSELSWRFAFNFYRARRP